MQNLPKNVLLVCAGLFAFIGLWGLVSPVGLTSLIEVEANGPDGVNDLRAMYGGLQLGIAAVLVWHAQVEDKISDGLLVAAMTIGGLGSARCLSLFLNEAPAMSVGLVLLELGTAVVCFWLSQRT